MLRHAWKLQLQRTLPPSGSDVSHPFLKHSPKLQRVRALLHDQELDSRASTGAIYWEGLSELLDAGGRRVGLGYLEMTGYAARLRRWLTPMLSGDAPPCQPPGP